MKTKTWFRESTNEWVVETDGKKNDCSFNIRYSSKFKWFALLLNWIFIDSAIKDCCKQY